jgi:hypothetical protein
MTQVFTANQIASRFTVTEAQMDKATRIVEGATGHVFYQVKSQSVEGQIYEVRFNRQFRRLTCTCKAGQEGFGCWHKRAAMASAAEYKQEENLQARQEAEQASFAALEAQRARAIASVRGLNAGEGVCQSNVFHFLK